MFDLCRLRCKNTTLFYIVGDIFEKDEKTPQPEPALGLRESNTEMLE